LRGLGKVTRCYLSRPGQARALVASVLPSRFLGPVLPCVRFSRWGWGGWAGGVALVAVCRCLAARGSRPGTAAGTVASCDRFSVPSLLVGTIRSMPKYASVPVGELKTFRRNPRRGDVAAIADSLGRWGQYRPIVVNAGSVTGRRNEVLAGNHTLLAARSLGWESIDCSVVDVDEETAAAIVLADNRLADLGEYASEDLFALLSSLDDLTGTGYFADDLVGLERELFPPVVLTDPDDVPDVAVETVSELGQVWELGPHRLLVGDSTDLEAVRGLVGDEPPDCVWTDPPYGVDYVGGNHALSVADRKKRGGQSIQNDGAGGLAALLDQAFAVVADVCGSGVPVYVAHADTERINFENAMTNAGISVRQNLIWVKGSLVMGRSDYHYRHEPILYGFTPGGAGRLGRGGERWHGDNSQTTVFEFARPPRNAEHPTMKPVALIDAMLKNSLPPGGIVFDPFGGSGSTLIAAHGRGGRALLVELDPRYADVILRRFEAHTGVLPRVGGRAVSFVGGGSV